MDWLAKLLNILLHLNLYLGQVADSYGSWIYALLFLIIFSETGLVVTPFLPGDALLFTVGTLTAQNGPLNLPIILVLLTRRRNSRPYHKLLDREQNRPEAVQQSAKPHFQSKASGTNARVLRTTRGQNDHAFTVHSA